MHGQPNIEKIQGSSKADKNNLYFTFQSIHTFGYTSLISSENDEYFTERLQRKSKNTFYVKYFFFSKILPSVR